jgi:hypothetical protein
MLEQLTADQGSWHSDKAVTNLDGVRVWLKGMPDGKITDCCTVEAPCDHHKTMTVDIDAALEEYLRRSGYGQDMSTRDLLKGFALFLGH